MRAVNQDFNKKNTTKFLMNLIVSNWYTYSYRKATVDYLWFLVKQIPLLENFQFVECVTPRTRTI